MFYLNLLSVSPALGFFSLTVLFLLCAILVFGIKAIMLAIRQKLAPPPPTPVKKRQPRKRLRTVEINPDEVDRVYFKIIY